MLKTDELQFTKTGSGQTWMTGKEVETKEEARFVLQQQQQAAGKGGAADRISSSGAVRRQPLHGADGGRAVQLRTVGGESCGRRRRRGVLLLVLLIVLVLVIIFCPAAAASSLDRGRLQGSWLGRAGKFFLALLRGGPRRGTKKRPRPTHPRPPPPLFVYIKTR